MMHAEIGNPFEMVEENGGPETWASDGLISMAICEAAVESWRTLDGVFIRKER
jgi:hypothetical protein